MNHINERYEALQEVALELISAHDIDELLELILKKSLVLLKCDGGSLYLRHSENYLLFNVAFNQTIQTDFVHTLMPISNSSIVSYVFFNAEPLMIEDVYKIGKDSRYAFDSSLDKKYGYRTKSMLAYPLCSSKGEILGVLQLINKKNDYYEKWPISDKEKITAMPYFNEADKEFLRSFAALASAAIEKASLYKDIERLLKGFIQASVKAIESRDPPTCGHSERVAVLTVELAKAINRSNDPSLRDIVFSDRELKELEYASLLHDFGKISIRERTLLKANKLRKIELLRIKSKINDFIFTAERKIYEDYINNLRKNSSPPTKLDLTRLSRSIKKIRSQFKKIWKIILRLNEPTVQIEDKTNILKKLKDRKFVNSKKVLVPLLTSKEISELSISKGSLNNLERREVENHVTSSYLFLKEIPWSNDFSSIPDIVYAHHEKLNGNGYPRHLTFEQIPLQSRLIAICDIFDALVVADRPYKSAVSFEKALRIMCEEEKEGNIDGRFLKVFIHEKIYEHPSFIKLIPQKEVAA